MGRKQLHTGRGVEQARHAGGLAEHDGGAHLQVVEFLEGVLRA